MGNIILPPNFIWQNILKKNLILWFPSIISSLIEKIMWNYVMGQNSLPFIFTDVFLIWIDRPKE
jgi:hypothetical protein